MDYILLLSGPLAAGKTEVAALLTADWGFSRIRSSHYLQAIASERGGSTDRAALQTIGDALDAETDFRWLIEDVAIPTMQENPGMTRWLVDSVRKPRQVDQFRGAFPSRVFHLHLNAPEGVLRERYEARLRDGGEYAGATPYEIAISHPNEIASRGLISIADAVLSTEHMAPSAIVNEVIRLLEQRSCDR